MSSTRSTRSLLMRRRQTCQGVAISLCAQAAWSLYRPNGYWPVPTPPRVGRARGSRSCSESCSYLSSRGVWWGTRNASAQDPTNADMSALLLVAHGLLTASLRVIRARQRPRVGRRRNSELQRWQATTYSGGGPWTVASWSREARDPDKPSRLLPRSWPRRIGPRLIRVDENELSIAFPIRLFQSSTSTAGGQLNGGLALIAERRTEAN